MHCRRFRPYCDVKWGGGNDVEYFILTAFLMIILTIGALWSSRIALPIKIIRLIHYAGMWFFEGPCTWLRRPNRQYLFKTIAKERYNLLPIWLNTEALNFTICVLNFRIITVFKQKIIVYKSFSKAFPDTVLCKHNLVNIELHRLCCKSQNYLFQLHPEVVVDMQYRMVEIRKTDMKWYNNKFLYWKYWRWYSFNNF